MQMHKLMLATLVAASLLSACDDGKDKSKESARPLLK